MKKYKRKLLLLIFVGALAFSMAVAGCNESQESETQPPEKCDEHIDANSDLKCDKCGEAIESTANKQCITHIDIEGDKICNICGEKIEEYKPTCSEHIDTDENSVCDTCGATNGEYKPLCTKHIDTDENLICDTCGEKLQVPECTEHEDIDNNQKCDVCGKDMPIVTPPECTEHEDVDNNQKCDVCGKDMPIVTPPECAEHEDVDNNKKCDVCGKDMPIVTPPECTEHEDVDNNQKCDVCGKDMPIVTPPECTEHEDVDNNQKCDVCGKDMPIVTPPVITYTVTVPSGEGYTVTQGSQQEVNEGSTASFTIVLTDARDTLVVKYGTKTLTAVGGIYKINNVSENITVTVEVIKHLPQTVSGAVVYSSSANKTAADILVSQLGGGYAVSDMSKLESDTIYKNCIIIGTGHFNTAFQSDDMGEEYLIKGDGTNVYIDGNCTRAVLYGAYDLLRSLGFEFYTAYLTKRPDTISINYNVNIRDSADFAVRGYLSTETGYTTDVNDYKFIVACKNNNGQFGTLGAGYGGQIEYGYYSNPLHNFLEFFLDKTEGKYGKTVATGVAATPNMFAPCLTNGITHNQELSDNTLTYAAARMKALILANPDKYYFTLTQNDGPTWYCDCENCTASNTSYNHSGTLVRFMNAMIAALESDAELADRDFKIVTFAYAFTKTAPTGGVAVDEKLCIWYAQYQDSRYSITDEKQAASFKDDLIAWSSLTKSSGATMALWLYDTSFNNYLAYYPSITINNAAKSTITAAKEMGVENIFVQGAYLTDNNWQSQMKAYIWSKLMWDSTLDAEALQNEFIDAYFGTAAAKVKEYIATYDAIYNTTERQVTSGYNYYQRSWVTIEQHLSALKIALEAVEATDEGSVYWQRARGVVVSSYASIIYDYDEYYKKCSLGGLGITGTQDRVDYLGATSKNQDVAEAKANFYNMFKTACSDAGITRACEGVNTIQQWLDTYVAQKWG